jgi:hypothetical protein
MPLCIEDYYFRRDQHLVGCGCEGDSHDVITLTLVAVKSALMAHPTGEGPPHDGQKWRRLEEWLMKSRLRPYALQLGAECPIC